MGGEMIALGVVLAYLLHTYFFWKKGQGTTPERGTEEGDRSWRVPAGLSHLAWPTARHRWHGKKAR